jgi:hypothetical protein
MLILPRQKLDAGWVELGCDEDTGGYYGSRDGHSILEGEEVMWLWKVRCEGASMDGRLHLHSGLLPSFLPELHQVHLGAGRSTDLESCMKLITLWTADTIR